eukprot:351307-Chlamydomonas_euryale.AAC.3
MGEGLARVKRWHAQRACMHEGLAWVKSQHGHAPRRAKHAHATKGTSREQGNGSCDAASAPPANDHRNTAQHGGHALSVNGTFAWYGRRWCMHAASMAPVLGMAVAGACTRRQWHR